MCSWAYITPYSTMVTSRLVLLRLLSVFNIMYFAAVSLRVYCMDCCCGSCWSEIAM